MSKRVAIATPASLISMLWAVANGWQQFRLAEDAARIKEAGEEMYKRLTNFINYYARVGKDSSQRSLLTISQWVPLTSASPPKAGVFPNWRSAAEPTCLRPAP